MTPFRRSRAAHAFGWSLVLMAAALALAVGLLTRCAHGAPQSFEQWCQEAIRRLPVYHEDQPPGGVAGRTLEKEAQLTALAAEVAKVSRRAPLPPRQWAALLFSTGWHESTFSLRIMRGDCKKHECDGGRARGAFQGQQHAFNREQWPRMHGLEHADVQVWAADQILRRHVRTCPGMGVEGIFAAYMGKRCESTKKTQERFATFGRLRP